MDLADLVLYSVTAIVVCGTPIVIVYRVWKSGRVDIIHKG
jgi:hypothetical protein